MDAAQAQVNPPEVLDDLSIGLLLHDPTTTSIVYANEYAEDLFGYSASELQTMGVGAVSADGYTQAEAAQRVRAAADGTPQRFEWYIQRASGELCWVEVRLTKTNLDDTLYVVAQIQDITESKQRERRLRLFARLLRHNLRNKVNVIQGHTTILLDTIETEEYLDPLRRLYEATTDLCDLTDRVNDLKSMTEPDETRCRPVNVSSVVTDIITTYRKDHPDVTWRMYCEDDFWVTADEGLRTAITEAIENAVAHNPHDTLHVGVHVIEDEDWVSLKIIDTGHPIPATEVEAVEGEHSPSQLVHGTGTGLWLMQAIVETFGGRLSIPQNTPQRTVVEFILPQTSAPSTE